MNTNISLHTHTDDQEPACRCQHITTPTPAHLRVCPYHLVPCPSCNQMIPRHLIHIHQADSCTQRQVTCHLCGEHMPASSTHAHLERHTSCSQCDHPMLLPDEALRHALTTCTICGTRLSACHLTGHTATHSGSVISSLQQLRLEPALPAIISITEQTAASVERADSILQELCATFSRQYKYDSIELLEGGRVARNGYRHGYRYGSALINLPFDEGVWEWEIKLVKNIANIYIGASPGLVGECPGSSTMPDSIGMSGGTGYICVNSVCQEGGFPFTTGDTIILRLDFTSRTITWTKKSDPSQTVTRPLPQAGPYVPAVGMRQCSVRIESFRRIE
eukprot:gnl/Dysnectes_brevis/50_a61_4848.p1 GENE.gnl/Dysnectes_brevis/50_a61_4848~~gnl/Dysnectes_brevis/50_a61_4848.p1  ORF type:complete len:334 (-),score=56.92 gnl/Dysnectes_brevis/50_a61_4848:227-1228(-)